MKDVLDAQAYCRQHDGELLSIRNTTELEFLQNVLLNTNYILREKTCLYIGAYDPFGSGVHRFSDGTMYKLGWQQWQSGQPELPSVGKPYTCLTVGTPVSTSSTGGVSNKPFICKSHSGKDNIIFFPNYNYSYVSLDLS